MNSCLQPGFKFVLVDLKLDGTRINSSTKEILNSIENSISNCLKSDNSLKMNIKKIVFVFCIQIFIAGKTVFGLPDPDPSDNAPQPLPQPLARRSSGLNNKATPPRITEEPANAIVDDTEVTVRLYCRATGFPDPTIRWLKDGQPLDSQSVRGIIKLAPGELMFLNVRHRGEDANTGTYQCIAVNSAGEARSSNVTVQMASIGEDFVRNPDDMVAASGTKVTLVCEGPSGVPEPTITWRKEMVPVSTNSRRQILNGNLVIQRAEKSDSGSYECVASNSAGERVSTAAILRIQAKPEFTLVPTSQEAVSGQTVELECQVKGDPRPRIRWSKDGGSLPSQSRVVPLSNGNLRITSVQASDSGEYVCTAENQVGSDSRSAIINVQVEPVFSRVSPDTTVEVGESVTLLCRASGNPLPTVFWRDLNGNEMFLGRSYQDGHVQVTTDGDLIIRSIRFEDEGLYKCQALSGVGTITTKVQLTVQPRRSGIPPPIIHRGPSNQTVGIGTTAILKCSSNSQPKPTLRWYKDGEPVQVGSDQIRKTLSASGDLQIYSAEKSDSGKYTCRAASDYGITSWDAKLSVLPSGSFVASVARNDDLPGQPGRPAVVNTTSQTIAVRWQPNQYTGASPIQFSILEYYRIGSSSASWQRVTDVTGHVVVLRHLEPSSDYVILVRSVNHQGASVPSQTSLHMRTKDIVQTRSPVQAGENQEKLNAVRVTLQRAVPNLLPDSTSGAMQLSWQAMASCDDVDGFKIFAKPLSPRNRVTLKATTSCLMRTHQLQNLVSGIKYELRIRPYKGQLTGFPSPIEFVSLQAGKIQPKKPTLSGVPDNDQKFITFTWTLPDDVLPPYVTGYALNCYSSKGASYSETIKLNTSTYEWTLSALSTRSTYVASLTYLTPLGEGTTSDEYTVAIGGGTTAQPDDEGGFVGMMQKQPGVIAGLAVGLIVVLAIIIGGVCYYRRSRRTNKGRGLHVRSFSFTPQSGPHRVHRDRFDASNSQYSTGFQITAMGAPDTPSNSVTGDRGSTKGLGMGTTTSSENSRAYLQRSAVNIGGPTNVTKNAVVSYNTGNGNMSGGLEMSPSPQPAFSYVTDQLTSMNNIQPQFSSANLSRPSIASTQSNMSNNIQHRIQQQQLLRQRSSTSIGYTPPPNGEPEQDFGYNDPTSPSVRSQGELPPPPPSPPLSQRTAISDRSRSSSGVHSTGERSSRSGQRSRRGTRAARVPTASVAPVNHQSPVNHSNPQPYLPTDTDTGIGSLQQTPSPARAEDMRHSPTPPTPPVRGASAFSYGQGHPALQFDRNRDPSLNPGYLAGPSEGDSEAENDHVGQLRVRTFSNEADPRNSMAVSGVSMMNAFGSESDDGDRSSERDSPVSALSDDDGSLQMESASQVGQNLIRDESPIRPNPQPRIFKPIPTEVSPSRPYTQRFRSSEEEPLIENDNCLSPTKSKSGRKTGSKPRRTNNKKNSAGNLARMNSASSSSSSYLHNTGDSGMSAGVGCSTEHSSLNSNSSASSGASKSIGSKVGRSRTAGNLSSYDATPTNEGDGLVEVDFKRGVRVHDGNYSTPVSPTTSGVSEQSGYVSTASSCWQFQQEPQSPTKHNTPRRPPRMGTGKRLAIASPQRPNDFADRSIKSPGHYMKSPDRNTAYHDYDDVTPTRNALDDGNDQFHSGRGAFIVGKLGRELPQELSDVPEVSTSDFCEDYSDQSQ
uniref:roundabout homolog 2-like isoform X3 n=1 Tax=Ciona intestinalis TaxID=7719 RepID=UPI00089DC69C|nr:roundabout homolog 2-like isoform X3 [Ciona intestinalis]XP_026696370.1 roundabout homolog 2-like isoform X4 [Ciona intestinalis]|eukprot:XP_018673109.1 roundabout homolog 2-like isoform X3 [Ciona intestinalis]